MQGAWERVSLRERAARLGALREAVVEGRDEVVAAVRADTGKTRTEALLSSLVPTLEMLRYLERESPRILRARKMPTPAIYRGSRSRIRYRPRGVVLVVAPWNNPFQLMLVPAACALAAGNAVLIKPSEETPRTARVLSELCTGSGVELPVEVVQGDAGTGQALVDSGPDMVLFTGAASNGPDVLRSAAPHLMPVILELGGKDPMLVFEDADLERAANAAVYGAFAHAGQHCVSTKRLYVQEGVRARLLDLLEEKTRDLAGKDEWGEVREGPVLEDAREQVREALANGARLLFPDDERRAATVPTLLADATHAMRIMREETFAPVLTVAGFGSEEEAAQLANDCPYGLNASVWSRDVERCEQVVRRLETGNVFVNDVLTNIGNPHLPFGGAKRSGLWHYHGEQGLLQFCRPVAIMENQGHAEAELGWFPHDEEKADVFDELIELRYGDTGLIERAVRWLKLGMRLRRGEE